MSARRTTRRSDDADVARGRAIVLACIVALFVTLAGIGVASARSGGKTVGPLARPHVRAGVKCISCHTEGEDKKATCNGCHDPKLHASTHPGHRALMQKGQMGCATCHPAHGDAYGVTFTGAPAAVLFHADSTRDFEPRISAPKGTTVPLVRLGRCTACHSLARPEDPIARCVSKSGFSKCWDEHDAPLEPRANAGACGRQHGANRYVAWEVAESVLDEAPPPIAPKTPLWSVAGAGSAGTLFGLFAYAVVTRRKKVATPTGPALASSKKRLPMIDETTCIGCNACVDACPFDVIELEKYVARVARPSDCCGVVLCEQVCPNGSLVIRESDEKERGLRIDEHGESLDTPGLFVAGDLTGLPLIKNAIAQGSRVVARIKTRAKEKATGGPWDADLVIVGAGPAGLSATMSAKDLGLRARTFEQGEIAASIRAFPRDKLVYDAPLSMPVEGPLEFREASKEELVATWTRLVRKYELSIDARTRVASVTRENGGFRVTFTRGTSAEETLRTRFLLFATGKHGTPRPFDAEVTDGARAHVHRFLADAASFAGKRVVVVGLGDSAMEAAIAIARQPGAAVTIVHRGADFTRGRKRNVSEVSHLVSTGAITLALGAKVVRVSEGLVELVRSFTADDPHGENARGEAPAAIEADAVLVLIGGEPAWALLERAGLAKHQNFPADQTSNDTGVPV